VANRSTPETTAAKYSRDPGVYRKAGILLVIVLAALPLLGCGVLRTMVDSAGKLFGGGESTVAGGATVSNESSATTTNPEPPPAKPLVILTQRRGNPIRTAILDTLRHYPGLGDENGSRFVVLWLAMKDNWAMMQGRTEGRRTEVEALLKRDGTGNWTVVSFSKGSWLAITSAGYPQAPKPIFSGARAWPKEKTSSASGFRNLTNAKGNATRTAILDAVRASMGWSINGKKIVFTVRWLGVQGNWAYLVAEEYNVKLPLDCLLRRSGSGWAVVLTQGEGDFERTIRQQYPNVPQAIFDGYP